MEWLAPSLAALVGVLVQLGGLAWFGGRMAARLDHLENRLDRLERRLDQLFMPSSSRTSSPAAAA